VRERLRPQLESVVSLPFPENTVGTNAHNGWKTDTTARMLTLMPMTPIRVHLGRMPSMLRTIIADLVRALRKATRT